MTARWPALPYGQWHDTRDTLHLWLQVVGKLKLSLTPFLNEWWNVALVPTARGVSTGRMPAGEVDLQVDVDLLAHRVEFATSDGRRDHVDLTPRSVADFHAAFLAALDRLEIPVSLSSTPSEIPGAVPFEQDTADRSYDPEAVTRWWQALLDVTRVLERFRSPFAGKSSPVQLYWGGLDLNHTRFSGRPAVAHGPAGSVQALAEDQENLALGFWPGDERSPGAVLYAYLSPATAGVDRLPVRPQAARWSPEAGEFVLAWDDLIASADPDASALEVFTSVYEAVAGHAGWDREHLELTPPAAHPDLRMPVNH